MRLDGFGNFFSQFTNKVKFLGFRFAKEELLHRIRMFTQLSDVGNMGRLDNLLTSMFVNSCHSMSQQAEALENQVDCLTDLNSLWVLL